MQGVLFGPQPKPKPVAPKQSGLPFVAFVSNGRRGEMPAWWIDETIGHCKARGLTRAVNLTELQGAYDRGLNPWLASERIAGR